MYTQTDRITQPTASEVNEAVILLEVEGLDHVTHHLKARLSVHLCT